jgi:hypothetical protein
MKSLDEYLDQFAMALTVDKIRRRLDHTRSWAVDKLDVRATLKSPARDNAVANFRMEELKGMWLMTQGYGALIVDAVINPELSQAAEDGGWTSVLELVCTFPSDGQEIEIQRALNAADKVSQEDKDKNNALVAVQTFAEMIQVLTVASDLLTRAYLSDDDGQLDMFDGSSDRGC